MKRTKTILVIFLALLALFPFQVNAQTDIPAEALMPAKPAEATESATMNEVGNIAETKEINSFEYFWPVVAGKVRGDRFYSLKRFKENLQGMLIFNKVSKAEYHSFLATKRIVESEKLINDGKTDQVNKALDDAKSNIEKANELSQKALNSNAAFGENGPLMVERMDKISTFSAWLSIKHTNYTQILEEIIKAASETKTTLE